MDNRITVVVGTDGSVIATKQDGVFRRSNESKQLVALISYPSDCIVSANFIRADGVKPKSRRLAYTGQQEYDGEVYSAYMYELTGYQLYASGPLVVSLDIKDGETLLAVGNFVIDVEPSESALDDEEPTDENQFDAAIDALQKMDAWQNDRIDDLEDKITAKTLADFTVDDKTGEGVKYYSDGSTATVQFPTGGIGTVVVRSEWLTILAFAEDSWALQSDGSYALAFGSTQTGFNDANFMALMSRSGTETYKAGTDLTAAERNGFYTQTDAVFIGSDGSIYMTANAQYGGRLVLFGGAAFSANMVKSIAIVNGNLFVTYIDGTTDTLETPWVTAEEVDDKIREALTWKNYT